MALACQITAVEGCQSSNGAYVYSRKLVLVNIAENGAEKYYYSQLLQGTIKEIKLQINFCFEVW